MQFDQLLAIALGFVGGLALAVGLLRRRRARERQMSGLVAVNPPPTAEVEGQSELSSLTDHLDVGIVRLGPRLEVVRINRSASRLLQADTERVIGKSLMELFVDHRVDEAARAAIGDGSATYEITLRADEDRRVLLRFRRGPGDGLWLLLDDVTELRRLQRIRTEFIDNLSHELRTPLTTIRLLTETLTQDVARPGVDIPERVRERILKIDVETGHLAQMVSELLDLSRIEGGAEELHFDNVRIGDVIKVAVERLRTFADRQLVGLETELPEEGLPAVWGDDERLGQVLVNLLHNAVKFSPPSSVVIVSGDVSDGHVTVAVRDQGVGIADADLDRIFERFYKVDKARQRGHGGTGLGLAIARHIIEGHGGRIWAESDDGSGSVFKFTVPVTDPQHSG
ncbi:MAG: sensor histidine kinase [Candidatus Limnocylindrales bacterium]